MGPALHSVTVSNLEMETRPGNHPDTEDELELGALWTDPRCLRPVLPTPRAPGLGRYGFRLKARWQAPLRPPDASVLSAGPPSPAQSPGASAQTSLPELPEHSKVSASVYSAPRCSTGNSHTGVGLTNGYRQPTSRRRRGCCGLVSPESLLHQPRRDTAAIAYQRPFAQGRHSGVSH